MVTSNRLLAHAARHSLERSANEVDMELGDTDSLASVNIPLPHLIEDEEEERHSRSTKRANLHPDKCRPSGLSPSGMLTVPGQVQVQDVDEENGEGVCRVEDRSRSVLSVLRSVGRPLSALSARARSALSTGRQNLLEIPAHVRNFLQRWVRARRGRVGPSEISTPDSSVSDLRSESRVCVFVCVLIRIALSLSSHSIPPSLTGNSVHSGTIKKKLDSLAGSEYGSDSDEEDYPAGKYKWRPRCPQALRRPLRRLKRKMKNTSCKLTWHYTIDPHGKHVHVLYMHVYMCMYM